MEPESRADNAGQPANDQPSRESLTPEERRQLVEAIGRLHRILRPAIAAWLAPVAGPFAEELADDVLIRLSLRAAGGQVDAGESLTGLLRALADERLAAYVRRRYAVPCGRRSGAERAGSGDPARDGPSITSRRCS